MLFLAYSRSAPCFKINESVLCISLLIHSNIIRNIRNNHPSLSIQWARRIVIFMSELIIWDCCCIFNWWFHVVSGLFTADVDLQQQRLRSIHQKAMYAVGNFALAASLLIFAGNGVVLVWKFLRRRWDPVHTLLSSSLAAANFLVGVGLCFLFIVGLGKDGGKHYSILCESSGVINMVATEAGVGFLFLIAVDRLIYTKNFDQVHGLSEKKTFVYCLLVWTFSLILGVVPSLPVPYFERELFNNNIICSHLHALYNRKSGWQYVACVHLVLNLVMFIVMLVLYIRAALYLRSRRSEPNQPLDRERSFYCKNAAIFTLSFITWIPGLAIGQYTYVQFYQ